MVERGPEEKTILKRNEMFVETRHEEVAKEFLSCWKPVFKNMKIIEVEV
jgi:hypothetical protein